MSVSGEWERFERAAEHMRNDSSLSLSNEQKLKLYGYFKQANEGKCSTAKPGFFDFTGRAKWEAWHSLGAMTKEEAVRQYLELVSAIAPAWESHSSSKPQQLRVEGGDVERGGGGGGSMGLSVSRMADQEQELSEEEKTVFDWCKEGREDRLQSLLSPDNINTTDEQGMTLLHWACDRGHIGIVELLVRRGSNVNLQDAEEQTPLHYASSCDQGEVVTYLLSNGADPTVRDSDDLTPMDVAGQQSTKELFKTSID